MELNDREKIGPEDMTRINEAIGELSSWGSPQVWVGEPVRDEDGNLRGPRVDWYRLSEMKEVIRDDLLPPLVEQELFEESMHIVAAKQGLVTVKKFLPAYDMTLREKATLDLVQQDPVERHLHRVRWGMNCVGSWLRAEEAVREHVGLLFPLPSDKRFPRGSAYLVKFEPREALTRDHLPYIEDFLRKAVDGPKLCVIEAPHEVEFLVSVLEEMDQG